MANQRPPPPPPPVELQPLAQVLGEAGLLKLIETFGGTELKVPKGARGIGKLAAAIGEVAARALSEARGGETLRVPLARNWRARVYFAAPRSMSQREIARKLGATESAIYNMLRTFKDNHKQRDLFSGV